jgi:hypothetical protein
MYQWRKTKFEYEFAIKFQRHVRMRGFTRYWHKPCCDTNEFHETMRIENELLFNGV